ncbi:MAG: thioredoxin family protein [bacterium]|nr:thioredoxin family protein [bacterium]
MKIKLLIVVLLCGAVAGVLVVKARRTPAGPVPSAVPPAVPAAAPAVAPPSAPTAALPRLVDLGADKCIPCKMMAPILQDLKTSLVERLTVEFIDVWQNPEAGKPYKIKLIPTQIFLAADGRELFRHEGFFSKEDILAKWKEFGVDLAP